MIKMFIDSHVECPLFLSHFRKVLKYRISGKSVQWEPSCCCMWTDRREEACCRFPAILRTCL